MSLSSKTQAPAAAGKRRRRWLALAVLLAAGAIVVYDGSTRTSAGPAHGAGLAGAAPAAPTGDTFRVAAFNIHGAKGRDGRRDLGRIADLLAGVDLAGLNEVHGVAFWQGVDASQAGELGRRLGVGWLYAPTERRWWAPHFGNAVLSRLPVGRWQRAPLASTPGRGLRNVVLLRVETPAGDVRAVVTHVDREADRQAQLAAVLALYRALAAPKLLLGDLNTPPGDPQIAALLAETETRDVLEGRQRVDGAERIDWILVEGLAVVDAGAVATDASDHPLIWAELAAAAQEAPADE